MKYKTFSDDNLRDSKQKTLFQRVSSPASVTITKKQRNSVLKSSFCARPRRFLSGGCQVPARSPVTAVVSKGGGREERNGDK